MMSGGSYNYLYSQTQIEDLLNNQRELERMAETLQAKGHTDAAKETLVVLFELQAAQVRLEAHMLRLGPVWKAIEWVEDCDWGPQHLDTAINAYRGLDQGD